MADSAFDNNNAKCYNQSARGHKNQQNHKEAKKIVKGGMTRDENNEGNYGRNIMHGTSYALDGNCTCGKFAHTLFSCI
ncbi:MAG: hypothetical protein FWH17_09205 [Oscillospiraceae bacterium]|nr:hypothetical protein [Oscillospiraceae bacterium]